MNDIPPIFEPEAAEQKQAGNRRAILWGGAIFLCVIVGILLAGKAGWLISLDTLTSWVETLRGSPWGIFAVIGIFTLGAFIGMPQYGMIFATVAAFGPLLGGLYSWVATMISGTLNFWMGRYFGERALQRHGGARVKSLAQRVAGHAFKASLLVRLIPSGPFIMVNMAFGVSQSPYLRFMLGMAIGIFPKILVVVMAGQGIASAIAGRPILAGFILTGAVGLFLILMIVKRVRKRMGEKTSSKDTKSA